jgi:hypothetical protein
MLWSNIGPTSIWTWVPEPGERSKEILLNAFPILLDVQTVRQVT